MKKGYVVLKKFIFEIFHKQYCNRYTNVFSHVSIENSQGRMIVENSLNDPPSLCQRWHTKENPCKIDKEKGYEDFDGLAKPSIFALLLSQRLFYDLEQSVQASPNDKRPTGSMPDATNEKCEKDVPIVSCLTAPASSQRNIDVVLEPSA